MLSHLVSDPISTQLSNLSIISETIMVNPPKKRYVIKNTIRSGATKIFFIISTLTFTRCARFINRKKSFLSTRTRFINRSGLEHFVNLFGYLLRYAVNIGCYRIFGY